MVEVEGNKANKNRKSIYVTVRVNPHVPGPMETRNRKAGQEVCQAKSVVEKLAADGATLKSFWPANKSMKLIQ